MFIRVYESSMPCKKKKKAADILIYAKMRDLPLLV